MDSFLNIPVAERLRWNNLTPDNLPEQVRRLRLAGCPEPVVRNVVFHRVNELYREKIKAVVDPIQAAFFDLVAEAHGDILNFAKPQQEQLTKLDAERRDLLEQLLGDNQGRSDDWDVRPSSASRTVEVLTGEQQEKVARIEAYYAAQMSASQRLAPADRAARLADLEKQKQAEMQWTLGPETYQERKLQQSSHADRIRSVAGFSASSDELRAIVQLREEADRDCPETGKAKEKAADELFKKKFLATYGEQRWAAFERGRDTRFQEEYVAALASGRTLDSADAIWRTREWAEQASRQIQSDSRSPREREMRLDALRLSIVDSVAGQLESASPSEYLKQDGGWIDGLR